jgi:protein-disulfide isomerase
VRKLPLLIALAIALSGCNQLMREEPVRPATPVPAASSSLPADTGEPEIPVEPEDMTVTGSGAASALPAEDPGFADDERVLENGMLQLGNADARVRVTAYLNHGCAYCRTFTEDYLPKLLAGFIRRGDVKLDIVVLPFKKYPNSGNEAAGLLCAARQGKGLAMHRALTALTVRTQATVRKAAVDLQTDAAAFDACVKDPATAESIAGLENAGTGNGATLVPAFDFDPATEMVLGLPDYADMRGKIEARL